MTTDHGGDVQFIASSAMTVHRRDERDDGRYSYHPACGTRFQNPARVDADDPEEAVMKYNLSPCSKCIDDAYTLERWRKDVHDAVVMENADTPERWLD